MSQNLQFAKHVLSSIHRDLQFLRDQDILSPSVYHDVLVLLPQELDDIGINRPPLPKRTGTRASVGPITVSLEPLSTTYTSPPSSRPIPPPRRTSVADDPPALPDRNLGTTIPSTLTASSAYSTPRSNPSLQTINPISTVRQRHSNDAATNTQHIQFGTVSSSTLTRRSIMTPVQHEPEPVLESEPIRKPAYEKRRIPEPYKPAPPEILATAEALYDLEGDQETDLSFRKGDIIEVTEHINEDWWRGTRTISSSPSVKGPHTGIFPKNYVRVVPGGGKRYPRVMEQDPSLDADQTTEYEDAQKREKVNQAGRKVGKKVGEAALFGFGATVGSKVAGSLF